MASNLYIWCNADHFVQTYGLSGLCSGMFISEASEAKYFGFKKVDWDLIDKSNERFALIVSSYIKESLEILYRKLLREYAFVAKTNPIAKFNLKRLYLTHSRIKRNTNKVAV